MRRLLLARHGQSLSNAARRFQGQRDIPLSPLGERQAAALGAALRRRARPLAAVYTSPLARARRTAEIAAASLGMPVVAVDDLRELSLGDWEDLTVDEVRCRPGDPYTQWVRDPLGCPPPGAEPLPAVQARVVQAVLDIQNAHPDGEEVLLVCHGGVISAFLAYCLGLPLSGIWRLAFANGSISEVTPPRVLSINDTGHLAALGPCAGGGLSP
jgi:phosphoserine phosphatase